MTSQHPRFGSETAPLDGLDAPVEDQAQFWNRWNEIFIENARARSSQRQAEMVMDWVRRLGRSGLEILDVGCGSGWMSARLSDCGSVTGVDLSSGVLDIAQQKFPRVRFIAGDFMTMVLPAGHVDVAVSLEVLAHVADQPAFLARLAELLKPGGLLMLSTQNRFVFERLEGISPLAPGLIRRWVDLTEARRLIEAHFHIETITTIVPQGHRGVLRLVNSPKLNRLLAAVFGQARLDRCKERFGLGQTIIVLARRR